MATGSFNESNYEQALIELFEGSLGYTHVYGPDVTRDYTSPLYETELIDSLYRINRKLPKSAVDEALHKLKNFEIASLVQRNEVFTDYLQNGISVNYTENGQHKAAIVKLVDYDDVRNNSFVIANQWTVVEYEEKRADMIVFLNGLPVVVIELKSPSREETDASEAYTQLKNYMLRIPSLFIYNAFCVMSDQAISKAGTITAGEDRFMAWKTVDGSYESTQFADFNVFFEGMFQKERFLDILKNFICFDKTDANHVKILAGYHQYFAVRKAVESAIRASGVGGDHRGGVFWHTQGSGKSLSMVFFAKLIQQRMNQPTFVVITDRNDLDNQLYAQFVGCADFLRQTPIQAQKRKLSEEEKLRGSSIIGLSDWLSARKSNGIIFTTMQKFTEADEPLSLRDNIIVMADEAHRSQYGLGIRIDTKNGKITRGQAQIIRDALPNATYMGFTGTPISKKDRSTIQVFGDYIDVYDMTQSVEDGATRPIYYENRVIKLKLDEETLHEIDEAYETMAATGQADEYAIERSKHDLGRMESILGAPQTITALCSDIIHHYEDSRQYEQTGKAMIVAYSRAIAISIYKKILELRPEWQEKIAVVVTDSNKDPLEWKPIIRDKRYRQDVEKRFKDNSSPLKIVIVVDMWLAGFNLPSLSTMYFYKAMQDDNLMQAIARVNRVFKDKEGGLIVDYIGIAAALKEAMKQYTNRDRGNYGDMDVAKTALPKFQEKLQVCAELLYGYHFEGFATAGSDLDRAKIISGGADFLAAPQRKENKDKYLREALLMRNAYSLCRSLANEQERLLAAYHEAVRTLLTRIEHPKKLSLKDINREINELLRHSVQSEGVLNLFSTVGKEFSLFDSKFLAELAKMKERNILVELLKKLIEEQVRAYRGTNVVQSTKFSEILARLMRSYLNGQISNEEVIKELLKIAEDIRDNAEKGEEMGLSTEEMAFYDALTKPQAVKDFYKNDDLIAMTKELTEQLRRSRTVDWSIKESARAGMRRMVKRLLKKYHYPPEGEDEALTTVMDQCEMWVDNAS